MNNKQKIILVVGIGLVIGAGIAVYSDDIRNGIIKKGLGL